MSYIGFVYLNVLCLYSLNCLPNQQEELSISDITNYDYLLSLKVHACTEFNNHAPPTSIDVLSTVNTSNTSVTSATSNNGFAALASSFASTSAISSNDWYPSAACFHTLAAVGVPVNRLGTSKLEVNIKFW